MDTMQTSHLAAAVSSKAEQFGYDVSPDKVAQRLENPSMLIGDAYRFVAEQVIPTAVYYVGQLYNWYTGASELPQTAIEDRKIEAVSVAPQMSVSTQPEQKKVPEDEFFDAETGELDSGIVDCPEPPVETATASLKRRHD